MEALQGCGRANSITSPGRNAHLTSDPALHTLRGPAGTRQGSGCKPARGRDREGTTGRMIDIQQIGKWNRDLSRAIEALGSEVFFTRLIEAIRGQIPFDYPQIWLYHRDLPPKVLHHQIPPQAVAAQIDYYLEGPYREDPFFQISMNQPRARIYRLSRITAGKLE